MQAKQKIIHMLTYARATGELLSHERVYREHIKCPFKKCDKENYNGFHNELAYDSVASVFWTYSNHIPAYMEMYDEFTFNNKQIRWHEKTHQLIHLLRCETKHDEAICDFISSAITHGSKEKCLCLQRKLAGIEAAVRRERRLNRLDPLWTLLKKRPTSFWKTHKQIITTLQLLLKDKDVLVRIMPLIDYIAGILCEKSQGDILGTLIYKLARTRDPIEHKRYDKSIRLLRRLPQRYFPKTTNKVKHA